MNFANRMKLNKIRRCFWIVTLMPCIILFIFGFNSKVHRHIKLTGKSNGYRSKDIQIEPICFNQTFPVLEAIRKGTLKASPKIRTIYMKTLGRFGNMIYEFAYLLAISNATKSSVTIATRHHEVPGLFKTFPFKVVNMREFKRLTKSPLVIDLTSRNRSNTFQGMMDNSSSVIWNPGKPWNVIRLALENDILIKGHLTFQFFSGCEELVFSQFQLKDTIMEKAREILDKIASTNVQKGTNVTKIGIHVRRGDYLEKEKQERGLRVAPKNYFINAMKYFSSRYPNPIFVVATNDRQWVKDNLIKKNVYLLPESEYYIDFAALIQCDHAIQSVGTFGNWIGFFTGGESVYFRDGRLCKSKINCDPKKYVPKSEPLYKGWIAMV